MLYIQMGEAWIKGTCSPYEFRKCLIEDLEFVKEFDLKIKEIQKIKQEEHEHEQKVKDAMVLLQRR
jgi:hypothetical protein